MTGQQATRPQGSGAGGAVRDAAKAAASGAARGAAVGGAAGAAAGAGRAVAVSLARNRTVWKALAIALLAIVVVIALTVAMFVNSMTAIASAITGVTDNNAWYAVENDGTGINMDNAAWARDEGRRTGVPWTVILAAQEVDDEFEAGELAAALDDIDPGMQHRDLATGAVSNSVTAMHIPERGAPALAAHDVRETYLEALQDDRVGFGERDASRIYDRALAWTLGEADGCSPPRERLPTGGDGSSDTGGGVRIDGSSWTPRQVRNMEIVIGIAKTMFGSDAEEAAIIGLITAVVESNFWNYANDGVVGPEDNNMGSATADEYAKLAYSLELDHDRVGSDHSSLGIMQQQAVAGWGDYSDSTWQSDPEGVIERLMSPEFAVAKFFVRMDRHDWRGAEPGGIAQAVQVSAHPGRYQQRVRLAEEIWASYSDTPAIDVPVESGWHGGEGSIGSGPRSSCAGGAPVTGEWTWPVEVDEEGMMTGRISALYGPRIHPSGRPQFHWGTDFTGAGLGSDIRAAGAGVVTHSALSAVPACGHFVRILHADGTASGYLHQLDRAVAVGDQVEAGAYLGRMGGNQPGGCTFGAHLHFTAYDEQGDATNPEEWLAERGLVIPEELMIHASNYNFQP